MGGGKNGLKKSNLVRVKFSEPSQVCMGYRLPEEAGTHQGKGE